MCKGVAPSTDVKARAVAAVQRTAVMPWTRLAHAAGEQGTAQLQGQSLLRAQAYAKNLELVKVRGGGWWGCSGGDCCCVWGLMWLVPCSNRAVAAAAMTVYIRCWWMATFAGPRRITALLRTAVQLHTAHMLPRPPCLLTASLPAPQSWDAQAKGFSLTLNKFSTWLHEEYTALMLVSAAARLAWLRRPAGWHPTAAAHIRPA